ncbi:MAG: tRNA (adenosine(37)-N6)-threonylcarbamoyltransferase complex ATPase subunit type 1 TsaE [Phycisphaerae bacterium]
MPRVELIAATADDTHAIGRAIGAALRGGELLALRGPLGAGKTALVRGIAEGLSVPPDEVASPTFVLLREYAGRLRLLHLDCYRLADAAELLDVGWDEFRADSHSVVALEWSDRAAELIDFDAIRISLEYDGAGRRIAIDLPANQTGLVNSLTRLHMQRVK